MRSVGESALQKYARPSGDVTEVGLAEHARYRTGAAGQKHGTFKVKMANAREKSHRKHKYKLFTGHVDTFRVSKNQRVKKWLLERSNSYCVTVSIVLLALTKRKRRFKRGWRTLKGSYLLLIPDVQ